MISEAKKQVLEHFAQGRRHYKLMEFDAALDCFKKALLIDEQDGPSKVYANRCIELIKDPPPEDWDGVFVMKTK
jgi:tetratricopeptide (TPR) repeat protein